MSSRSFWILVPSLTLPLMGLGVGTHPFFIVPLKAKAEVFNQQIRDTQKRVNGLFSEFPDLVSLQLQWKKEESQTVELRKKLLRFEKGIVGDSESLSSIRARGGGIDLLGQKTQGSYSHRRLRVSRKATPQEWVKFLDFLEKSSPYLRVFSLRVETEKPGVSDFVGGEVELEMVTKFSPPSVERNKR